MTVLDSRTLVPLGVIAVIVVGVGGLLIRGTWTSANTLTAIRSELASSAKELAAIKVELASSRLEVLVIRAEAQRIATRLDVDPETETWSFKDMTWWVKEANWMNPEVKLPEPKRQ